MVSILEDALRFFFASSMDLSAISPVRLEASGSRDAPKHCRQMAERPSDRVVGWHRSGCRHECRGGRTPVAKLSAGSRL